MSTAEFKSLFPTIRTSDILNDTLLDYLYSGSFKKGKGYDLIQSEDAWKLEIPFPGFEKEDISITVSESSVLRIESEKQNKWTDSKKFEFKLSELADLNSVDAEMKSGILKISLSKKKTPERKTIKIK